MFHEEFALGGPVMYLLFVVWVLVFSLILDRLLYWAGRAFARRPQADPETIEEAEIRLRDRAERNLAGIDGLSHLATSIGLFGTVLGIAQAFFARGEGLALAAPEVLASGMATALFTTVAGLSVFLVGQGFLLLFGWWTEASVRRLKARVSR
jgi:biopolymer transport protein ExbB/TolQ